MAEFESVRFSVCLLLRNFFKFNDPHKALRDFPSSMYNDDAAGRAARFAAISSRVPGRDKLVRPWAASARLMPSISV